MKLAKAVVIGGADSAAGDNALKCCAPITLAGPGHGSRARLMFGLGTAAGGLALLVLYGVLGVLGVVLHTLRG
jgi:hypothetical protein